jgi:glyoxylase-like metal-dependent hydrolase (beta-lactamase superfamily II)
MELYTINTGYFKLDGGAMFGVVPKVIWKVTNPADENNLCNWAMRCLLVVIGDRKILIDNGIGDKQSEKFFSHFYLHGDDSLEKSLNSVGFTLDDITDNVLSHLHFDHAGGGIKRKQIGDGFEPLFKNATYWVTKTHWDLAMNPNDREKASFFDENLLPMQDAGQLKFIEKDTELFPGFSVKIFNGHTVGQAIPFINYNGRTIVYMADLLPSTGHIPLPYVMSYDTQPLLTLTEKEEFMKDAADKNYVLFFEHDYYSECCTVKHTPRGVRLDKTFSLEAFKKEVGN